MDTEMEMRVDTDTPLKKINFGYNMAKRAIYKNGYYTCAKYLF